MRDDGRVEDRIERLQRPLDVREHTGARTQGVRRRARRASWPARLLGRTATPYRAISAARPVWRSDQNHVPPYSTLTPVPGSSRYQVRPPSRSRASSTTTERPASRRSRAAIRPAKPPPTTTTSGSVTPASQRTHVESGARNSQPDSVTGRSGIEPEVRQPVEQHVQRHAREVPAEPRAQTEVRPDREREVRALLAADVEPVGVGEASRVAARRRQDGADQGSLLQRNAGELRGPRRLACGRPHRPGPPQRLLDRRLHQRPILADAFELLGLGAERPDGQRDQVARLLQPAGQHQLRVRDDLLARHALAVVVVAHHPRQHRAVRLALETIHHATRSRRRAPRSPGRRAPACSGSPSKFARPGIMPSFQRRMSCHGTSSRPEHELQRTHGHRIAVLGEQVDLTAIGEPVDQLVRRAWGSCPASAPPRRAAGTAIR